MPTRPVDAAQLADVVLRVDLDVWVLLERRESSWTALPVDPQQTLSVRPVEVSCAARLLARNDDL
jgi:hypothetical protein